jgi:hypothetical protein
MCSGGLTEVVLAMLVLQGDQHRLERTHETAGPHRTPGSDRGNPAEERGHGDRGDPGQCPKEAAAMWPPHQYTQVNRNSQTTSTKCQYQAAASKPTCLSGRNWL